MKSNNPIRAGLPPTSMLISSLLSVLSIALTEVGLRITLLRLWRACIAPSSYLTHISQVLRRSLLSCAWPTHVWVVGLRLLLLQLQLDLILLLLLCVLLSIVLRLLAPTKPGASKSSRSLRLSLSVRFIIELPVIRATCICS
ncbi:hypothetical protein KCU81_g252, partial [Aureobasidium melanogenum]